MTEKQSKDRCTSFGGKIEDYHGKTIKICKNCRGYIRNWPKSKCRWILMNRQLVFYTLNSLLILSKYRYQSIISLQILFSMNQNILWCSSGSNFPSILINIVPCSLCCIMFPVLYHVSCVLTFLDFVFFFYSVLHYTIISLTTSCLRSQNSRRNHF